MGGWMGGRRTAEKKRRKNFVLVLPDILPCVGFKTISNNIIFTEPDGRVSGVGAPQFSGRVFNPRLDPILINNNNKSQGFIV